MPTRARASLTASLAILVSLWAPPLVFADETGRESVAVGLTEAKALVALVPEVQSSIKSGYDVQFASIEFGINVDDYYVFQVLIPNEVSCGTIGWYAVNKRTADLWDSLLTAWVCSPEIEQRQNTIRREHQITAQQISQFRDRPIDRGEQSAGYMLCREDRPAAKWGLEVARQHLRIDSVSDMTYAKPWGYRDEHFWDIVRLGKAAVPDLLTLVEDGSPTGLRVDLFGGEYQVGDIAVLAMTKIYPDLPLVEFVDNPQQPRFETVGFGVYWAYVRESHANRRTLQAKLREWVAKNEERLQWVATPRHPAGGWHALESPGEE